MVFSVVAGYPTNAWPGRDAILELVWPLCCKSAPRATGQQSAPSLAVKRLVAALLMIAASITAWFDPEFDQVYYTYTCTSSPPLQHSWIASGDA